MGCEEREWKWREKIQEAWASASRWNSHFHLIFKICFGSSTLWIEIFAEEFWAFMGLYDVILLRWKIVCLLFIYESQGNVKYIPNDAISMKRGDNFDIWILNCCEIGLIWNLNWCFEIWILNNCFDLVVVCDSAERGWAWSDGRTGVSFWLQSQISPAYF